MKAKDLEFGYLAIITESRISPNVYVGKLVVRTQCWHCGKQTISMIETSDGDGWSGDWHRAPAGIELEIVGKLEDLKRGVSGK